MLIEFTRISFPLEKTVLTQQSDYYAQDMSGNFSQVLPKFLEARRSSTV